MNMRRGFGLGWALVTFVIAGAAAWFAYHAGLATTIAASGRDGAYYPGYPGYYGFGFGLFPLLLFIILIALLFRRRHWHGYWGGHGHGYGPPKEGSDVPPVIEERLKSWHDKAHDVNPSPGGAPGSTSRSGGIPGQGS